MSLDELRAAVAVMRELGVTRWDGIELGPAPAAPIAKPEPMTEQQRREAHMRTLFAASGVMPEGGADAPR